MILVLVFVYFIKIKNCRLGYIKETVNSKLLVATEHGTERYYRLNQIEFKWQDSLPENIEINKYLHKRMVEATEKQKQFDINLLYESCRLNQRYTFSELAHLFFGENCNGWELASFYLCLKNNEQLFYQRKRYFSIYSRQEIQTRKEQAKIKEEVAKNQQLEKEWANILSENKLPNIPTSSIKHWDNFIT